MPALRCDGCQRLLATTTRTQPVPVQCLDPFCAPQPKRLQNEERDGEITFLLVIGGVSQSAIAREYLTTRQGVHHIRLAHATACYAS